MGNSGSIKKFMEYNRKCHDCGKPTNNYRCNECWEKKTGKTVPPHHMEDPISGFEARTNGRIVHSKEP